MAVWRVRRGAAAGGAALGATLLFAPSAVATTFEVTKTADTDDDDCSLADCSLREAAFAANQADGDDDITFASGVTGEITLSDDDGDIEFDDDGVSIVGPGAGNLTVSGGDASRIFHANPDAGGDPLAISGLTLADGNAPAGDLGGALYSDDASVTLSDLSFTGNQADGGGAVFVDFGTLEITGSSFVDNHAYGSQDGGALYLEDTPGTPGGAVEVSIRDSAFLENTAERHGGAVYLSGTGGEIVIERSTIGGNQAADDAGAIYVRGANGGATIRDTTIADNRAADGEGGGLFSNPIALSIENTTISGNEATEAGGGIYIADGAPGLEPAILNSTITDNAASVGPEPGGQDGGGIYLEDALDDPIATGPMDLSSTIVAGNTADGGENDLGQGEFADGFTSGFSLIGTTSGAAITESPAGSNLFGQDPQLGALAANGGPTLTHLPSPTSPALDAGIANGLVGDQRGFARTVDQPDVPGSTGSDGTDIGAVELAPPEAPELAPCRGAKVPKLEGTDGGDRIRGTGDSDVITGLAGNDMLEGLGAADCIEGDEDRDTLKGGGGGDRLAGGDGNDRLRGQGASDRLTGQDKRDNLNGGGGKDRLVGAGGKDKLRGGPGRDKLKGGPGSDKLIATSSERDKVNCGGGRDKVRIDTDDKVSKTCEKVVEVAD